MTKPTPVTIVPFSLRNSPALIEVLLPAQKLSIDVFKEREGRQSQTLTALGSYWKGRKPLVLNKACILGALLPATDNLKRDLEVFEMLMGMDDESFLVRWGHPSPELIVSSVPMPNLYEYFAVDFPSQLPGTTPLNASDFETEDGLRPGFEWLPEVSSHDVRRLELEAIARIGYGERVDGSQRVEQLGPEVHEHIWEAVNSHLGTDANCLPELTHQLGVMRFGRRPKVGDTFSGSGQIPFEAARLGCDAYASDLNPISCMLTWGAFNIVGANASQREEFARAQSELSRRVKSEIDSLGIEVDKSGARAKVFLYCVEVTCPETGWTVPMLPTRVVSKGQSVIASLIPDLKNKRYEISIKSGVTAQELKAAEKGTVDGGALVHVVAGKTYRTKIATLRGDRTATDGGASNKLRRWELADIQFRPEDILRERLYAVQWQFPVTRNGKEKLISEFRTVTADDLAREQAVVRYVNENLREWQQSGAVPDMAIEHGDETARLLRERGWTHWHHLFNPRQLLTAALINKYSTAALKFSLMQVLNVNSRLSRWNYLSGVGQTAGVFDNQALNTLYNFGARGFDFCVPTLEPSFKTYPLPHAGTVKVTCAPANSTQVDCDVWITDPPFGDAVKYEEILEFFIAWLRKSPPTEFADWVWDSRRALAIKGEDDDFRKGMIGAYRQMAEKMPDNGIQIVMFTHQSGSIWADMASIVWASGLQVTAAWYVVTETDSALRDGSYVKGTVLLVLRKRLGTKKTYQGELAWELEEEVNRQVRTLTGLNQDAHDIYRDQNLFSDSDLQMAGYAAALRVLTKYAVIDGKDMAAEAQRPRIKGHTTLVDELIEYAVGVANQALVPSGIEKSIWDKLQPAERFYLKMLDLEAKGSKTLDNYQNFAKAFKVRDFKPMMGSERANAARVKSADEFGRSEMGQSSEFFNTPVRGILYGLMELQKDKDGDDVVAHLADNIGNFYNQREVVAELADYMSKKLQTLRPVESSNARVLRDLVRNQRM